MNSMTSLLRYFTPFRLSILLIVVLYFILHIVSLTRLPIFADEAIYIRWTQLMIDDWSRYAFFPLNDGKTPLLLWLAIPFQFLPFDQLATARFVSVLIGFFQIMAVLWIMPLFGGSKKAQIIGAALVAFLPFWFFHHGLFLHESLLALFLTISVGSTLLLTRRAAILDWNNLNRTVLFQNIGTIAPWLAVAGLSFGAALLTKVPAILAAPALGLLCFYETKRLRDFIVKTVAYGLSISIGLVLFLLLALHPAFSQLFARGGDFLFPFSALIFEAAWLETIPSFPNYALAFFVYLTPTITFLNLASLFSHERRDRSHFFFWSGIVFLLPIMLMGRVVYPRYLFPASVFFTINAALYIESLVHLFQRKKLTLLLSLSSMTLALLLANSFAASAQFIYYSITNPDQLPFVSADKEQYLYAWSSGHGIEESVTLINTLAQTKRIAVATEGSFGTLPDGIMTYLHRRPVDSIFVDGIGYPVHSITDDFLTKTQDFDQYLLIANSDRLESSPLATDQMTLLAEYCRPDNAPCLQVWDFTDLQPTLILQANLPTETSHTQL